MRISHAPFPTDAPDRKERERQRLREACQAFEAQLNHYLLKSMRHTVIQAEEPERAREIFEDLLDETLAGEVSRSGEFGLSGLLYRELEPLLEAQPSFSSSDLPGREASEDPPVPAGAPGAPSLKHPGSPTDEKNERETG